MPFVMNASAKKHEVKVHGKYFTFTPKQIKNMEPNKVFHLISKCSHLGFVALSDKFEDPEYQLSEEGKQEKEEAIKKGVAARIAHIEWLKDNELRSLRQDMDQQNIKADVSSQMSSATMKVLKDAADELKSYKAITANAEKEKADQLKEIQNLLES